MRAIAKTLLILEVVVCFGPAAILLLLGALMVPMQIYALVYEPLLWDGPLHLIGFVVCGICGLAVLVFVLYQLFRTDGNIRRPWLVLACIAFGTLPILDIAASAAAGWRVLAAMPLVCTAHIVFLSRRILFPGRAQSRWRAI
jgi:hypothetical protein